MEALINSILEKNVGRSQATKKVLGDLVPNNFVDAGQSQLPEYEPLQCSV